MDVLPLMLLLGSLFLCGRVEALSSAMDVLKQDALKWGVPLTCSKWDCDCPFNRQRGCCCAANEMHQVEEESFKRIKYLWEKVMSLNSRVNALSGGFKVSFKATMNQNIAIEIPGSTERCFGPFNTNVPIPYSNVALNSGNGYNPSLGVFTAPCPGVYMFSFTAFSSVGVDGRLYHKVQLMKNGKMGVSVWENNREDIEDSATQVVVMEMQRGDQVYIELVSGRKLCTFMEYNIFTGHIVYPYIE
ncbi:PREDICTED: cerebellin-2-like [Poecilia mexicana]|uniref:cerebellin-2-like n=1 Tax=Poecilia mexicana TaxID=48701 RepID=UPI00072EB37B|nr:PREDICTED: cerebellin-2-like [Poecilia mexicana]